MELLVLHCVHFGLICRPPWRSTGHENKSGEFVLDKLVKMSTGIKGLDAITDGGLPAGRPTLVVGGPGSGKTLLGISFLVQGALHDEPGALISFDEPSSDLVVNSRSIGFDLAALQSRNLLAIEQVYIERQQLIEAGEYDLEGLFIRLANLVDTTGARRIVLDSLDTLFASIPNEAILRSELRRLFLWLKDRKLSTVVTSERSDSDRQLSRHGIEEYVSDCVILLDTRVHEEIATRRLRVVKYRGSAHSKNEYPFLIEDGGIVVLPVTSLGLEHAVSGQRISSGVAGLDAMLGSAETGRGLHKGSSILLTGGPGSGKTSIATQFAAAACRRGERCLYFAFEEAEAQLIRNMRSVGVDLSPFIKDKLLEIRAVRPTVHGLEMHLATMMHRIETVKPDCIVVDPLSALLSSGTVVQSRLMGLRLIDFIKSFGATALFLLVQDGQESTDLNVASLMDTWMVVENKRHRDGLERRIYVVKSRGMPHSADVRQLSILSAGIEVKEQPSHD